MLKHLVVLCVLASFTLTACDSQKTKTENKTNNQTSATNKTETTHEKPAAHDEGGDAGHADMPEVDGEASSDGAIPEGWSVKEVAEQKIAFAYPSQMKLAEKKVENDQGGTRYIYTAEDVKTGLAFVLLVEPNSEAQTAQSIAEGVVAILKSGNNMADDQIEIIDSSGQGEVDGFKAWHDISGNLKAEGQTLVLNAAGGKGFPEDPYSVAASIMYPETDANLETASQFLEHVKIIH